MVSAGGAGAAAPGAESGVAPEAVVADLYARFADGVFGFCVSLLRDRDDAADVTQDVFVLAAQRYGQLREPERVRAWLFAIARHCCYRRLRQRERVIPVEFVPDPVEDDAAPDALSAAEAGELVWAAASGLGERDRAVLHLNVYEGLDGADLAAALGVVHANPYSLVHRAKERLEQAVGALLVARLGRAQCARLRSVVEGWDGSLTPLMRKRLARHVEGCETCRRTRARLVASAAFAAVPFAVPDDAFALPADRVRTAAELVARAQSVVLSRARWQADGFPPPDEERRRRRWPLVVLVIGVAGGLGLAALVATRGGGGPQGPASAVTGTTVATGTTTVPATSAPVTAAPVTAAPVTAAPVTSAPVTAAPVTSAPVTAAPVTAAPVTSAPVTSPPTTIERTLPPTTIPT